MAEHRSRRIVRTLMDEPHVEGRRVSVLQVYDAVEGRGLEPGTVADRLDLDVADVYHALAYYHDNPREMQQLRADRREALESVRSDVDRPPGVEPRST